MRRNVYPNSGNPAQVGDLVRVTDGFIGQQKYVGKSGVIIGGDSERDILDCIPSNYNCNHLIKIMFEDGTIVGSWKAHQLEIIMAGQYHLSREWGLKRSKDVVKIVRSHKVSKRVWVIRNHLGQVWGRVAKAWSGHESDTYGWTYDLSEAYTNPLKNKPNVENTPFSKDRCLTSTKYEWVYVNLVQSIAIQPVGDEDVK